MHGNQGVVAMGRASGLRFQPLRFTCKTLDPFHISASCFLILLELGKYMYEAE